MKLMSKLGIVALTAVTVAPLAGTVMPVNASAKTKTYKISKNVLKSKKNFLGKTVDKYKTHAFVIHQPSAKKLMLITGYGRDVPTNIYNIKQQTVKGNTMTLKLTAPKTKYAKAAKGTIKVKRTGKNSYQILNIYEGYYHKKFDNIYMIDSRKFNDQGDVIQSKKTTAKGLKLMSKAYLTKHTSTLMMNALLK